MKTSLLLYLLIGLERFVKWIKEMPERQIAWFGSDRFAYSLMGGSVAVFGLFILCMEVLA